MENEKTLQEMIQELPNELVLFAYYSVVLKNDIDIRGNFPGDLFLKFTDPNFQHFHEKEEEKIEEHYEERVQDLKLQFPKISNRAYYEMLEIIEAERVFNKKSLSYLKTYYQEFAKNISHLISVQPFFIKEGLPYMDFIKEKETYIIAAKDLCMYINKKSNNHCSIYTAKNKKQYDQLLGRTEKPKLNGKDKE